MASELELHPVHLDLDTLTQEELPYLYSLCQNRQSLQNSLQELLAFPLTHQKAMPFYALSESSLEPITDCFSEAYAALLEGLERLFEDTETLYQFLDCPFLRQHGSYFIPYAQHCFKSRTFVGQSLYGRFDAVFDPETQQVTAIYEFNGDTPVMLFESINLQHRLLSQIDPTGQQQYNEWYGLTQELLKAHGLSPSHQIALACSFEHIEDLATCETLAQVMGEQAAAHLLDLSDIDYDHANPSQPFVIRNTQTYLDAVFVLSPWEEMVANFPSAFLHWERWADQVALLEPAWRWFISHKGMLAYVSHLLETDADFAKRYGHLPLLQTALSPEPFLKQQQAYVSKPVLGRLSANIQVFDEKGAATAHTSGLYADCPKVYQRFHPTYNLHQSNFILCMWMAGQARSKQATPATLCFREFDGPVLDLQNERFIPHILRPTGQAMT